MSGRQLQTSAPSAEPDRTGPDGLTAGFVQGGPHHDLALEGPVHRAFVGDFQKARPLPAVQRALDQQPAQSSAWILSWLKVTVTRSSGQPLCSA